MCDVVFEKVYSLKFKFATDAGSDATFMHVNLVITCQSTKTPTYMYIGLMEA